MTDNRGRFIHVCDCDAPGARTTPLCSDLHAARQMRTKLPMTWHLKMSPQSNNPAGAPTQQEMDGNTVSCNWNDLVEFIYHRPFKTHALNISLI